MARLFRNRQRRVQSPVVVQNAQLTRLAYSLKLSTTRMFGEVHRGAITAIAMEAVEGRYVLTAGIDRRIAVYDTQRSVDSVIQQYPVLAHTKCPSHPCTLEWYPNDNGIFVSSGMKGVVRVWDTNTMKVVESFDEHMPEHIYQHAVGNNCLVAVAGSVQDVILCDMRTGATSHSLVGHRGDVMSTAWCPSNDFLLATGGVDGRVLLWDVRRSKSCLRQLDQHNGGTTADSASLIAAHEGAVNGMTFTQDGQQLVTTGRDQRVRMWKTATGKNSLVNYPNVVNEQGLRLGLCVSSGGGRPVLCHPNGQGVGMYELYTGHPIATLRGHYSSVHQCCWNPTRPELYSISNDAEVLVWAPEAAEGSTQAQTLANLHEDAWSDDEEEEANG